MILTLAKRDLRIKYAQTSLGIFWTVLQPLTGLLIFTVFFSRLIHVDTNGIPYPLFAFAGMISWFFFSQVVQGAGLSLVEGQQLIRRVYFPRMVLLIAKVLVALVEFGVAMILLILIMLFMGRLPGWQLLLFPIFLILNIISALSIAIWLSALTIRYRDFHHTIPYLVGFGIWLTPVFYPETLIPSKYHLFLYLNPMATTITGFRWSLIDGAVMHPGYWLALIPVTLLLISGLDYFRKIEDQIPDYI
ncbi:MAG: ABC transporter permease [Flavitalea sp.]